MDFFSQVHYREPQSTVVVEQPAHSPVTETMDPTPWNTVTQVLTQETGHQWYTLSISNEIRTEPGQLVSVEVLDDQGRGIPGVGVLLWPARSSYAEWSRVHIRRCVTDQQGICAFAPIESTEYALLEVYISLVDRSVQPVKIDLSAQPPKRVMVRFKERVSSR